MEYNFTIEQLENIWHILDRMDKIKYTYYFVFGFCFDCKEDEVLVINEKYTQNGKRIILMKANGQIHKKILEIEKEYDFKFDRLSDEKIKEIKKDLLYLGFTDENNVLIPIYEPVFVPYELTEGFFPSSFTYCILPNKLI